MKKDYAHISVLLDRTGSMESIRDDVIGGFNAFLDGQKKLPQEATMTLVQFDTQDPYEVLHHFKPIGEIPKLTKETYVPRSMTPLLDAIGRGINDLEAGIAKLDDAERPEQVIFVIVTDGQENSSREFKREQIASMLKEKQENLNWQFVFLSADFDAFHEAHDIGFQANSTALFAKSAAQTSSAFLSSSDRVANYRNKKAASVKFTLEDRSKMKGEIEESSTET